MEGNLYHKDNNVQACWRLRSSSNFLLQRVFPGLVVNTQWCCTCKQHYQVADELEHLWLFGIVVFVNRTCSPKVRKSRTMKRFLSKLTIRPVWLPGIYTLVTSLLSCFRLRSILCQKRNGELLTRTTQNSLYLLFWLTCMFHLFPAEMVQATQRTVEAGGGPPGWDRISAGLRLWNLLDAALPVKLTTYTLPLPHLMCTSLFFYLWCYFNLRMWKCVCCGFGFVFFGQCNRCVYRNKHNLKWLHCASVTS